METNDFDRASLQILEALQADARLSTQALAEKVGLSATPVWRRVKELEDRGVIRGQVVLVDREKIGLSICVLANVSLVRHSEGGRAVRAPGRHAARDHRMPRHHRRGGLRHQGRRGRHEGV
jgi:DNA-binding Lrp family transcriptional regulator